jgi:hypothetical protein
MVLTDHQAHLGSNKGGHRTLTMVVQVIEGLANKSEKDNETPCPNELH